jgi:hypothetical protein
MAMDVIAHGLWAAAAVSGKKTLAGSTLPRRAIVLWAMFPDLLAFGPSAVMALWLQIAGGADGWTVHRGHFPHVEFGLPLYEAAHSLVVFAAVFGLCTLALRRPVLGMLGWLLHILIDIPTHSVRFYATRFAWPLADWRVDGIAWRTPWFFVCTYVALAVVYLLLWRSGRLTRSRRAAAVDFAKVRE